MDWKLVINMIYFDYAATCPLDEEAAEAYVKAATAYFGNSSSLHDIGSQAKSLLEGCREELATLLDVPKEGIYFTSGGSESNYLAIHSLLSAKKKKGKHIITGMAEHSSIHGTFDKIKEQGYEVTYLPLHENGQISVQELKESVREDTVLVSIQYVNSEIGSIQPIEEIGKICVENDILFHSDCVQAFGKVNLQPAAQFINSFSISAHKIYGPKGVGAVFIDPLLNWQPYYQHVTHENGFRPGTVNVPGIAAMLTAAEKIDKNRKMNLMHNKKLRKRFTEILDPFSDQIILYNGAEESQLPSIIGMRLKGKEGQWVMLECNRSGFAISTGSACQSGLKLPSKTMKALRIPDKEAKEFIRISFGKDTKENEVIALATKLADIIKHNPF
jgi:cysteine desulfurase